MNSNEPMFGNAKKRSYFIILSVIVLIGAFLRFYQINDQVLGDDEWHGINVASVHSYSNILSSFHESDNCIPLTLFYRVLMDSVGINELNFHIIQLLFGLAAIIILPLLVLKIVGIQASLIFCFLLSISPQLIYYSRYARPYSIVAFIGFVSVVCFYYWIKSGGKACLILYIVGTVLSSYLSILTIPFLLFPLLFALIYYVKNRSRGDLPYSLISVVVSGIAVAAGILACYFPALDSLDKIVTKKGAGYIETETLTGFVHLFSGSYMPYVTVAISALFMIGVVSIFRRNRLLFYFIVSTCLFQLLFVLVLMPFKIELAYVLARYNIVSLLFYLLFVSTGIHALFIKTMGSFIGSVPLRRVVQGAFTAATILMMLYANPLKKIYATQNNFTNHNDYQCDFRSLIYTTEEVDTDLFIGFYRELAKEDDSTTVVEFPYLLWWDSNFYHLYQKFHRKKVRIGHFDETYITPPMLKCKNLQFNSFVRFNRLKELKSSGAKYLIIHKDVAKELLKVRYIYENKRNPDDLELKSMTSEFEIYYIDMSRNIASFWINEMFKKLGPPIYNDTWIAVFRVPV